jgi:glycosyltransferase involved in cell wall biosynthesis
MLSWEYPPRIIGGLARVVAELSKQLAKQGTEVHVVTADHPGAPEHQDDHGVFVHRVKTQTDWTPDFLTWVKQLNFGLLQYAIELHRQAPFDIVHAHDWMVADAAWVMKKGFDVPMVATIHATEGGRMHGLHNDLQRYISQVEWRLTYEAWDVIVNSQHMLRELQNQFNMPPDKLAVIPNGIDPDHFDFEFDPGPTRRQYASEHQQIVLYVGRMVREKGVQVLLQAAQSILAAVPGTQFLLVGTGYYLDDLKNLANNLGISHNVHFLGYVSDYDLHRLYKVADVVCIPSLYEPFGIVALEGMAAQVPVVTSDAGGLVDFVEHGQTGLTTYAGDIGSLSWGILEVLRNKGLAQHLVRTAHDKVKHIYNWKVIAKRTSEVYEKVLAEAQGVGQSGGSQAVPVAPSLVSPKTKKKEE